VVADVTPPPIGVDFLSHFGLLVDCRNNRLLDGVTSLSAPAQAASALTPSVKTISDGTSVDSLLAEFLDLTRPAGIQSEVRHNTVHHIRTIPGQPVTCQLRQHAPDPLDIAKADFDAMLRDGTARRAESSWSSALQGQRLPSLRRLQSNKCQDHPRPLLYNQITVHPDDIQTTTITTPFGLFGCSPPCPSACATPPRHSKASWTIF
jgi:hypothetical protein